MLKIWNRDRLYTGLHIINEKLYVNQLQNTAKRENFDVISDEMYTVMKTLQFSNELFAIIK